MAYLEVEPGRQIYCEHYRSDGAAVVLVHGWGMSCRCWDLTLPGLLQAGYEVTMFDERCCGRSDKDFAEVSTSAAASDVASVIEETGIERPVVVGWSFGAAVTAQAVASLGDRVRGMVLVGPPTPRYTQAEGFPHGGTAEIMEQTLVALRDNRPDFLHGLADSVCHTDVSPHVVEWMWQAFMETSPRADDALRDLGEIDHRDLLPAIAVPTLICQGAHDQVVDPATATVCADLLQNARLLDFAGSGHAPFIDEREKFNRELLGFLEELGG
jgi:pimeloyl-ACP methyl ester carboxylesterase